MATFVKIKNYIVNVDEIAYILDERDERGSRYGSERCTICLKTKMYDDKPIVIHDYRHMSEIYEDIKNQISCGIKIK